MFNTSIKGLTYNQVKDGGYTKLVLLIVIEVIAVVGNILFIVAIFSRRTIAKQTRTYIYLANVSITNLGVAIFVLPFPIISLATGKWSLGSKLCYFNGFMNSFWLTSCVYSLTLLSIHKYFSVVRPLHRSVSYKPVGYGILMFWLLALAVTVITFVESRVTFHPSLGHCSISFDEHKIIYIVFLICVVYIAPMTVNILAYWRMFVAVRNHGRRMRFTTFSNSYNIDSQKKVIKTLYLAFMSFVISWTPFFIYAILSMTDSSLSKHFFIIAYMLGFSNSAQNPVIFILRNIRIQKKSSGKQFSRLSLVSSASRSQLPLASLSSLHPDDRRSSAFYITTNEYITQENHFVLEQNTEEQAEIQFCSLHQGTYSSNVETQF